MDGGRGGCGVSGDGCGSCGVDGDGVRRAPGRECVKCREVRAVAVANQTEALCYACLRHSLLSKFKTAVNGSGLVTAEDKVLVGFSGGPASRVALEFLLEVRDKVRSDGACKEQAEPEFGVGVGFVDESVVLGVSAAEAARYVGEIRAAVASAGELVPLHVEPLGSVMEGAEGCESIGVCGGDRLLLELLGSVKDVTGKEDLQEYLRVLVLQKIARALGYTKILLGLCTSRIAAHVIASTAKGRGFSLPADIQYADARFHVPIVLPLRDCVSRELALYCHLAKLKTVFIRKLSTLTDKKSINSLAHSFVTMLQVDNPARERTIVRTATKLKPFAFNRLSSNSLKQTGRKRQSLRQENVDNEVSEVQESTVLCPLCSAPLDCRDPSGARVALVSQDQETQLSVMEPNFQGQDLDTPVALEFRSRCCPSCQFQLLPKDDPVTTFSLLPPVLRQQDRLLPAHASWIRSQIAEYLLPDD